MTTAVYYKALRPDGTDFATGTTRPALGQWMPLITGELIMCRRGYHVSDAVAETLAGGSWPCLLARVEIPEGDWEQQGHKLAVSTYRVVEWLPAHQALGPNGQEVAALIERARLLTAPELQRLAASLAAPHVASPAAYHVASPAAYHVAYHVAASSRRWSSGAVSSRARSISAATSWPFGPSA